MRDTNLRAAPGMESHLSRTLGVLRHSDLAILQHPLHSAQIRYREMQVAKAWEQPEHIHTMGASR